MKKYLILLLVSFNLFAAQSFSVPTKISGGYVTSMNKVDGSFEGAITQWVVSVGTIVKTASTEYQGAYKGVWAGTGTGTLDLQWTATASNTYDLNEMVRTADTDMQICAYVNGTETGCKAFTATNITKVSVIASSWLGSSFYLRLKHTGSDAFSVEVDNGAIEPWSPNYVNTIETQSTEANYGASGISWSGSFALFPSFQKETSEIIYTKSVVSSHHRFTFIRNAKVTGSFLTSLASGGMPSIFKNGSKIQSGNAAYASTAQAVCPFSIDVASSDYIEFGTTDASSGTAYGLSITAIATAQNLVQSWQDGTEWTAYTPTFTGFGIPSSVEFQWRRDRGDLLVRGKFTSGTSTAVEARCSLPNGLITANTTKIPSLQIAGLGGRSDVSQTVHSALIEPSVSYFTFGEGTGALALLQKLVGTNALSNGQTLSYQTIRIPIQGWSSSPTILALPSATQTDYHLEANSNSGQVITAYTVEIPFIINTASSTMASQWDGTRFTAPISGNYEISGSTAWSAAGVGKYLYAYINENPIKMLGGFNAGSSFYTFSGKVYLVADQRFSLRTDVTSTLSNASGPSYHTISITRLNGKNDSVFVGNITPDTFVQTAGVINPVHFSLTYGTTDASTACTASPCSYLNQIGNYITSVTRSSLSNYVLNFTKTYSKVKCTGNFHAPGVDIANTSGAPILNCSNCSTLAFQTVKIHTSADVDTTGTLMCDAIP